MANHPPAGAADPAPSATPLLPAGPDPIAPVPATIAVSSGPATVDQVPYWPTAGQYLRAALGEARPAVGWTDQTASSYISAAAHCNTIPAAPADYAAVSVSVDEPAFDIDYATTHRVPYSQAAIISHRIVEGNKKYNAMRPKGAPPKAENGPELLEQVTAAIAVRLDAATARMKAGELDDPRVVLPDPGEIGPAGPVDREE